MGISNGNINVVDADAGLAAAAHGLLRLELPRHDIPPGQWRPERPEQFGQDIEGLLVITGGVTVDLRIGDRGISMLLGPGDIIDPALAAHAPTGWIASEWTVDAPLALAVLDRSFGVAARREPDLARVIRQRLNAQLARAMAHAAILSLPSVDRRLLGMLWLLAERWGTPRNGGVHLMLPLTHAALARLVAARRTSVTAAVARLREENQATRRLDGTWLLTRWVE